MPHIYINETEVISNNNEANTNVVYIPGIKEGGSLTTNEPKLFTRVSDFLYDVTGDRKGTVTDDNAIMAKELLSLGMPVLFESYGSTKPDATALTAGIVKLADKGLYRLKFLTVGAYADISSSALVKAMLDCAIARGDCIVLLDHAKTVSTQTGQSKAAAVQAAFKGLESVTGIDNNGLKLAAGFTPWCKCFLDGDTEGKELPASFIYLAACANTLKTSASWNAVAGVAGGACPFEIKPLISYGDADDLVLQSRAINTDGSFDDENDNQDMAVNSIRFIDPFGYLVWGNRTLNTNESGLTACSFLNIRNFVCDVKKALYTAGRKCTFEQNTDILWVNFCGEVTPLLDSALSGSGIRGYKLLREPTEVKQRLKAVVKLTPIYAVEDFDLTLELTDTFETIEERA